MAGLVGKFALQRPGFPHVVEHDDGAVHLAFLAGNRRHGHLDRVLRIVGSQNGAVVVQFDRFVLVEAAGDGVGDFLAVVFIDDKHDVAQ